MMRSMRGEVVDIGLTVLERGRFRKRRVAAVKVVETIIQKY